MSKSPNTSKTILQISALVGIILTAVIWPLSMLGKSVETGHEDADTRIQPIARIEIQKAPAASANDGKPRSAEVIYETVCKACHDSGVAGAPKTGDKAAWAPRIATGEASLLNSIIKGKGAMPPRSGVPSLTDAEIKSAMEFLVKKAR